MVAPQPLRDVGRVEQEEECAVGHQPSDRGQVEVEHALDPEPAAHALVRDRRVDVAVADDRRTSLERGPDHVVHVLGARGRVQQRLGPGGDVVTVEHELANPLAELGTPGLARDHDLLAVGLEPGLEKLDLRRLAGPVDPFEADEHSDPSYGGRVASQGGVRRMPPVRVIVTGGAGFIGSHVVEALAARGDEVVVVDSLATGKRENVPASAELVERDIREPLDDVFDHARPEAVVHLAAQADVRVAVERPDHDAAVNVLGTVQVLEAARRHGAQIVFSSTGGAIYGECDEPARETGPVLPMSPYGTSKLAGEEYLKTYNRLYGTIHVALRYGNVYGPRQDPHGEAGVVAIFLGALARGEAARIFGDGTQTRDYVYVGDVARATVSALGQEGGVFNIGTGRETSVVELYELCRASAGSTAEAVHAPARLGELQRSFLDTQLASDVLRFAAMVGLEDGLAATWDWLRSSS